MIHVALRGLLFTLLVLFGSHAHAQTPASPASAPSVPAQTAPSPTSRTPAKAQVAVPVGSTNQPSRPHNLRPTPPTLPDNIVVEDRPRRPSGFWTSNRPAKGGAYRYRLLGIGFAIMLITLGALVWLVRRMIAAPAPE